jgi:hypothetical protein
MSSQEVPIPTLTADWIVGLSDGDSHIENALNRLNEAVTKFGKSFSVSGEVPGCSALAAQHASLVEHLRSHLAVAQSLWGVRMKEHLFDLVHALQSDRVFVAALVSRAILETAAVIVNLEGKLVAPPADAPGDHFQGMLDELHGTVGRGRYPWDAWGDSKAMAEHFSVYRAGEDPELPSERRATNILTMIQKLDRAVARRFADVARRASRVGYEGAVRATYALLSDICHPAAGTGILLLEPGARAGWIRVNYTTSGSATRWLFAGPIGPLLLIPPVARVAYESLERLGNIAFDVSKPNA